MGMTFLEKKRFIINKIEASTSDDLISRVYDEINHEENWDETDDGKDLILRLLEKSQEQARNGEVISSKEHWSKVNEMMKKTNQL